MKLLLLAAGKSSRIFENIKKNKCLIKIQNKSLIRNIIDNAHKSLIKDIDVITGFKPINIKNDLKKYNNINFINNTRYKTTDMVYSALLGLKKSNTDTIISYTDIFYDNTVFNDLIKKKNPDITVPFIKNWKYVWKKRKKDIFDDAETFMISGNNNLKEIGNKINKKNLKLIDGQFMSIIYIPKKHLNLVISFYENYNNNKLQFTNFLNKLINHKVKITTLEYKSFWYEIDDFEDYKNISKLIK